LPGHKGANLVGNSLQAIGEVAQVRQCLQQQRHAAVLDLATAGQDPLEVGWRQQEVLNLLVMAVGPLKVGVGTAHGGSPRTVLVDVTLSPNGQNRQYSGRIAGAK
jgi:hypothetical protein